MTHSERRGRYDRKKSKRSRRRETRSRILAATAEVLRTAPSEVPNVKRITELAGVGRNTFYELFRDAREAARTAERTAADEVGEKLDRELETANTPVERLRALAQAWARVAASGGTSLGTRGRAKTVVARSLIAQGLEGRLAAVLDDARDHGIIAAPASARRLAMVAAGWETIARELQDAGAPAPDASKELVEFTLRAFR